MAMADDMTAQAYEGDWYGPEVATFGDRLAAARDAAGLTQGGFAKRLGVKKSTVDDWEQDLSEPRANRLQMMAGLLNVSISWLLTGEGEGIDSPDAAASADSDLASLLGEVRDTRVELKAAHDKLGRLEKRLRAMAKTSIAHD